MKKQILSARCVAENVIKIKSELKLSNNFLDNNLNNMVIALKMLKSNIKLKSILNIKNNFYFMFFRTDIGNDLYQMSEHRYITIYNNM